MPTVDFQLQVESERLGERIYHKMLKTNLWMRMFKQVPFPEGMGDEIKLVTYERTLPDNTPVWQDISVNDGTGNNSVPQDYTINPGQTTRSFKLQQVALRSNIVTVNDLRFAFKRNEMMKHLEKNLKDNTQYLLSERRRDEFTRIAEKKCVATSGFPTSDSFALQQPTYRLTDGLLQKFYQELLQDGAGDEAVDKVDNRPQLMLITSPWTKDAIFRDYGQQNAGLRTDIRESDRVKELLGPLGVGAPMRGFYFLCDDLPARWDWDGSDFVRRYPYSSVDATQGKKLVISDDYKNAAFEDSYIVHPGVMDIVVPSAISSVSGAEYNPAAYNGQWTWINDRDRINNPMKTWGEFYAAFANGTQPGFPDWAVVIRHQVQEPLDQEIAAQSS